jgi:hypothetical protein
LLDNLEYILESEIWDSKCIEAWNLLHLLIHQMLNSQSKGNFSMYSKEVVDCLKHIRNTINKIKI